ncbi:MAG: type VI secretion system lipoprotein TssJ [Nitrospirae bacterium]|nr:type VI secretion system lipoprotein TssJ [Nitrospirota bacterium]
MHKRVLICLLLCVSLLGVSSAFAGDSAITVTIDGGSNLNPDEQGQPLSVSVRFYQLSRAVAFHAPHGHVAHRSLVQQNEINGFLQNDSKILGGALVSKKDIVVKPSSSQKIVIDKHPDASYLAVAAFFRDAAGNSWNKTIPMSDTGGEVFVKLEKTTVSVTSTMQPPPAPPEPSPKPVSPKPEPEKKKSDKDDVTIIYVEKGKTIKIVRYSKNAPAPSSATEIHVEKGKQVKLIRDDNAVRDDNALSTSTPAVTAATTTTAEATTVAPESSPAPKETVVKEKDLNVRVWTDKTTYKEGEKVRVFVESNMPCYARIIYIDVKGNMVQILPNPRAKDNHLKANTRYEFPSENDGYSLEVAPPFGNEKLYVYASVNKLSDNLTLEQAGGVYVVKTDASEIFAKDRTRGLVFKEECERKRSLKMIDNSGASCSQRKDFTKEIQIETSKK